MLGHHPSIQQGPRRSQDERQGQRPRKEQREPLTTPAPPKTRDEPKTQGVHREQAMTKDQLPEPQFTCTVNTRPQGPEIKDNHDNDMTHNTLNNTQITNKGIMNYSHVVKTNTLPKEAKYEQKITKQIKHKSIGLKI